MELFYRQLGESGAPIIILHGLFGSSDNWLSIGKKLAENHKVYLVDQRNHGQSDNEEGLSYDLMAEDLKEFIEEHSLHEAIVIGHSMGGKVAMFFACENPTLLSKLVVVDIGPRYYKVHHREILDALKSLDLNQIKSRKEAEDKLSEKIDDLMLRAFLLKNLYWETPEKLGWRINLPVIDKNIEEVGKALPENLSFEKETLFIYGKQSGYVCEEDKEAILEHFPFAQFEVVKNAGHWVHAEQPEEFLKILQEFL